MIDGRWWVALVTFERRHEGGDILPGWAQGACGWMVALSPDEDTARRLILRDLEHHQLRVLEIADTQEVFGENEIEEIDEHLALNFREIEAGKQTVGALFTATKVRARPDAKGRLSIVAEVQERLKASFFPPK
jgi:hypothetical protein